jgi:hypothetical protein
MIHPTAVRMTSAVRCLPSSNSAIAVLSSSMMDSPKAFETTFCYQSFEFVDGRKSRCWSKQCTGILDARMPAQKVSRGSTD